MPWYPRFLSKWRTEQFNPPQAVPNDSPNWHTILPWTRIEAPGDALVSLIIENVGNAQLDDFRAAYRPDASVAPVVGTKTGANIPAGEAQLMFTGSGGGGFVATGGPPGEYMVEARTASAPGTAARLTARIVQV